MSSSGRPETAPRQCRGLRRLAPGALLMLAVVGAGSAPCAAAGRTLDPAPAATSRPLVDTIARLVGATSSERIRFPMPGIGLGLLRSDILGLCLDPPAARPQETLLTAIVRLNAGLRFVSRSIDPPAQGTMG